MHTDGEVLAKAEAKPNLSTWISLFFRTWKFCAQKKIAKKELERGNYLILFLFAEIMNILLNMGKY